MVIPMGGSGLPNYRGEIPEECHPHKLKVKFAVLGLIVGTVGRAVSELIFPMPRGARSDTFNLLQCFMVIVMGVFILKDDPHLKSVYDCLASSMCSSCHEQGMGGLGCLMPFVICCGMNTIFDLIFRGNMIVLAPAPYAASMAVSIAAEAIGAYAGYSMHKQIQAEGLAPDPAAAMEMGSGGLGSMQGGFLGGGSARAYRPAPADASATAPAAAAPASPQAGGGGGQATGGTAFQPFGGQGQRLGS